MGASGCEMRSLRGEVLLQRDLKSRLRGSCMAPPGGKTEEAGTESQARGPGGMGTELKSACGGQGPILQKSD